MRRFRIGFFIDSLNSGAGTENQLIGILKRLNPDRFAAQVFTLTTPASSEVSRVIPHPMHHLGVPKLLSLHGFTRFLSLTRRLRSIAFDAVMVYFPDSNAFVVPACVFSPSTVCIVNRRDMGYWNTPRLLTLLRFVNRRADYFLANAKIIRRHVAAVEGFPIQRIKVIPNGLWECSAPSPLPELRSALGLPTGSSVVGLVANLRPVKRIDRFLAVARAVSLRRPDTFFVILGDGPLHGAISAELHTDPIASKFLLLGRVPNVRDYLPLFDVAVLTSESEGLSNSLIEYAAAGVPSVAFDVGGNSEVVVDGTTGFLVRNSDVSSMADCVHTLLTDSELRARMSRAARELAMCRFSASTVQRALEDFLEAASTAPRRSLTFA